MYIIYIWLILTCQLQDGKTLVNPRVEYRVAEAEQEKFDVKEQDQMYAEPKKRQFQHPRQSCQNQRGGDRGWRGAYPNGRSGHGGGRGMGSRYENGRGGGGGGGRGMGSGYENGRGGGGGGCGMGSGYENGCGGGGGGSPWATSPQLVEGEAARGMARGSPLRH